MSAVQALSVPAWWNFLVSALGFLLSLSNCFPLVQALEDPPDAPVGNHPDVPVGDPPDRGVQCPVIGDTSPSALLGPQSIGPEYLSPEFPDSLVASQFPAKLGSQFPIPVGPELSVLFNIP
jgi:hypothetical protein